MSFKEKSLLICAPDYFDVTYEINPWMSIHNRPVQATAKSQWQEYEKTLKSLGFNLYYLTPGKNVPDLVFTANHGLVKGDKVVAAHMKYSERQLEKDNYTNWFKNNGFEVYEPTTGFYEGEGDSFIVGDRLIYGYGFRSEKSVAQEIKDFLGLGKIIYAELVDPYFYHFDTCFSPLTESLAMIYEPAFTSESVQALKREFELISIKDEEAKKFCCNAVSFDKDIVLPAGCIEAQKALAKHGYKTHDVQLNQFLKAGGAAKCLCLKLWN